MEKLKKAEETREKDFKQKKQILTFDYAFVVPLEMYFLRLRIHYGKYNIVFRTWSYFSQIIRIFWHCSWRQNAFDRFFEHFLVEHYFLQEFVQFIGT